MFVLLENISPARVPGAAIVAPQQGIASPNTIIESNSNSVNRMKRLINLLITVSALIHGMVIAAAAIDFPSGVITGLIYVILGGCISVYSLVTNKNFEGNVASLQDIVMNGHQVPITWYFTQGSL